MVRLTILMAAGAALMAAPVLAHHGKEFLLLETDDMPASGSVYTLLSADTNVEKDGTRSTEITPGILFGVGSRVAIEPHFHVAHATGEGWRYDATAAAVRYRIGDMPNSEWRAHLSLEAERPRRVHHEETPVETKPSLRGPFHGTGADEEVPHSEGTLRLGFTRSTDNALMVVNLLGTRQLAHSSEHSYGLGLGVLRPLRNGDRVGIEALARLPIADGVEVVPGYYLSRGNTSFKAGVGLFTNRETTTGTLHTSFIQRF